jgi:PAS domain S-box-containing protein
MINDSTLNPEATEQRLALLLDAVVDYAIYMLDRDGRVATWNSGARRFKGYEAAEIIGRHFSTFFTAEDRAADLPGHILGTAANEGRFEDEGWRVRKDGTRFWAHVVVDTVRDEQGTVIGFAKITRDITAKKEAERKLFESEQRFRMLVQGVRDYAIYMLDPDGFITNWNPGAETIKGWMADEIIGMHFSRFYTEEDRARNEPARALETARTKGKYEIEGWRVRKDGTRFWANVLIDPIFDENGKLTGYAKVTRDISDRRKAQEELEEARSALFQSQKLQAIGELAGGIAHDFNNLITVIRGSAEMLSRSDVTDEKRARYLQAIIETSDRASALTSHLLAFARRQALQPQVIDLTVMLDAFGEVLTRMLGSRIEVVLELAPGLWPIEVDPAQLESALLNAAINARDAMPDGGRLTLSTSNLEGADQVCVAVTDTGKGMSKDVLRRVFEPFFTTKEVGKGTGLGLSQIHGFAAQAGGRAEIESEVGAGTCLRLFLPRTRSLADVPTKTEEPALAGRGRTVLLVEDNELVRQFAHELLSDLDFNVISAASGDEALSILNGQKLDLLFSDVVMPGMSGVELAAAIRKERAGLPVLLASGYCDDLRNGVAGEYSVLAKPYGSVQLATAISAIFAEPTAD